MNAHLAGAASFVATLVFSFFMRLLSAPRIAYEEAKFAWHLCHCEDCRRKLRREVEQESKRREREDA